jgi:hypothetical protein
MRRLALAIGLAAAAALAVPAAAQTTDPAAIAKGYKAPRNNFGQPDLAGVWSNATITRLERDPKFGDRLVMTEEEAAAIEGASDQRNARLRAPTDQTKKVDDLDECQSGAQGAACGYNAFWTDPGTRLIRIGGQARTSILTNKSGRMPYRPEARSRAGRPRGDAYEGPESRGLGERCIVGFGGTAGPPMMPVLYNNHYQIQQAQDHVVIVVEMVHDARIIRLADKHGKVPTWMGDSVGRWEGETLVVESVNFRPDQTFRGATAGMKVIERFTRVSPQQILYQWEVIDPATFTEPVKGEEALNAIKGQVYEYACHEGNYGLVGILAGAREAEKTGRTLDQNAPREEGGN